jgi:hypothetical protein
MHSSFGHFDFGHFDFGHFDFGHFNFGHFNFGHFGFRTFCPKPCLLCIVQLPEWFSEVLPGTLKSRAAGLWLP